MATYSVEWTSSKFVVTVYGVSSGQSIRLWYRPSTTNTAKQVDKTATGTTVVFDSSGEGISVSKDTTYYVNVRDSSGTNIGQRSFTTNSSGKQPSFSVDSVTSSSVTITAKDFIPNEYVYFQIVKYSNSAKSTLGPYYLDATTLTKEFTGLSSNTVYYADVKIASTFWIGGDAITSGTKFTTLASGSTRPSNWSWTSTIQSGSAIKITASEWNNFCTRINAFRAYKGLSSYSFTTAVSGSTSISASICNEAWSAINGISGRGAMPSQAMKGEAIYASFFTGLRDALNAIS